MIRTVPLRWKTRLLRGKSTKYPTPLPQLSEVLFRPLGVFSLTRGRDGLINSIYNIGIF